MTVCFVTRNNKLHVGMRAVHTASVQKERVDDVLLQVRNVNVRD